MVSERDRLKDIMRDMAQGQDIGHKLEFDPIDKRVKPVSTGSSSSYRITDPDGAINISKSDADLFGEATPFDGQVVVAANALSGLVKGVGRRVQFSGRAEEHVFQLLGEGPTLTGSPGSLIAVDEPDREQETAPGAEDDQIRVLVKWGDIQAQGTAPKTIGANARGLIKEEGSWHSVPVEIVPVRQELFSRFGGLLETDALADARVAIFGQGSGGSHIAIELVKSGVGRFDLVDHDRLEVCNLARHQCDLADIGRLKVQAMADAIKRKNPYAEVSTWPIKADWEDLKTVLEIVRKADLVFAATDSHSSKLLINQACVQEGKTCIFAGAHRRAHGGQVLRVRPGRSICFQCFAMLLPEQVEDQEISSEEHAEELAYTDRPVPIEPGLSTDIAPISLMATKVGIQELLQSKQTTLRSLDQDLVADWYLWLNRREVGTQYENLQPLGYNVDGMHVLRWYGIEINRHPGCPICGDFAGNFSDENLGAMLESVKALGD